MEELQRRVLKVVSFRDGRGGALCTKSLVNVDVSPSVILGVSFLVGGVGLIQLRAVRPQISRDKDIVFSSVALLCGGILVFQGWRLDPLLLFGQLLTAGVAASFALETLSLRNRLESEAVTDLRDELRNNATPVSRPGPLPPPSSRSFEEWDRYPDGYEGNIPYEERSTSGYREDYMAEDEDEYRYPRDDRYGYEDVEDWAGSARKPAPRNRRGDANIVEMIEDWDL